MKDLNVYKVKVIILNKAKKENLKLKFKIYQQDTVCIQLQKTPNLVTTKVRKALDQVSLWFAAFDETHCSEHS